MSLHFQIIKNYFYILTKLVIYLKNLTNNGQEKIFLMKLIPISKFEILKKKLNN